MPDDPYVYPGTFTLINLRGIRDPDQLRDFEANSTFRRGLELRERPLPNVFSSAHLKRIHEYLFQDVYAWAGEFRTVDIRKEGSTYFARPDFIQLSLDQLFASLQRKGELVGLEATSFAERAGDLFGDLNAIHPFREGNGRTQQELIRQLAARAGHTISWANVAREDMYRESAISFTSGNSEGLGRIIRAAIVTPVDKTVRPRDQMLEQARYAEAFRQIYNERLGAEPPWTVDVAETIDNDVLRSILAQARKEVGLPLLPPARSENLDTPGSSEDDSPKRRRGRSR
jgi:cell filamentation protein